MKNLAGKVNGDDRQTMIALATEMAPERKKKKNKENNTQIRSYLGSRMQRCTSFPEWQLRDIVTIVIYSF
jgi:hypothetical protein